MKLNKNGWGLRTAILFIFLFTFCLLASMIGFKKIGFFDTKPVIKNGANQKNSPTIIEEDTDNYSDLETNVYEAIQTYYDNNPDIMNNKKRVVVTVNELREEGYLNSLEDEMGNTCNGYAVITNDNIVNFNAYINCPNYKSTGYEEGNE